jgi:hypothetical protein
MQPSLLTSHLNFPHQFLFFLIELTPKGDVDKEIERDTCEQTYVLFNVLQLHF